MAQILCDPRLSLYMFSSTAQFIFADVFYKIGNQILAKSQMCTVLGSVTAACTDVCLWMNILHCNIPTLNAPIYRSLNHKIYEYLNSEF